ncbi:MAG: hypothetical protein A2Y25_02560 [Candidatus Melainabacteria bacterium GWF2_37_15]|nr:MAG: hypothetical protein A2Y25_02560 [Candidatus Melainabacteria bacterium GWF2_37_15]
MKYLILLLSFLLLSLPATGANYADMAHKAYKNKDYVKAAEYYEQAYQQDKSDVYLDNAIAAYLSHAFNLTNDKEYDQAIKYCEKVLSLKPGYSNAQELLCEIYYSRGTDSYFNGNGEEARIHMEKSLQYSVLPEQKQRALDELRDWKIQYY